jgi:hypothetical protein
MGREGALTLYRVTWRIDLDAESPRDAADLALEIQRDPTSIATVFEVTKLRARPSLPVVRSPWSIDVADRSGV